uniref:Uncharacterized protein n=1 Tax=Ficus carica TaxID=3494 RepID=A0AA87YYD2_FICCA|nr:hypothetical protein TIFTF001_048948 [Ficus carica]GMN21999.1 hypothetical protein TIFTF001_048951 [Ficus carica]
MLFIVSLSSETPSVVRDLGDAVFCASSKLGYAQSQGRRREEKTGRRSREDDRRSFCINLGPSQEKTEGKIERRKQQRILRRLSSRTIQWRSQSFRRRSRSFW